MVEGKKINDWTNKHYDYYYTLTEEDIESGKIKIDPYFVSNHIKLGEKDASGILFHCLKNIFRWGHKNSIEREATSIIEQIKRYIEINNLKLEIDKSTATPQDMEI